MKVVLAFELDYYIRMDMNLLYFIQSLRTPFLDGVMVNVFNNFVGSKGQFWVWLGLLAFIFPKTRKCGICILVSYLVAYFIGDGILKNLIARPRPCSVDTTVALIVSKPSSFSCPSVHSYIAFASATAILVNYRKIGIAAMIFALCIGFSRLYFFVHFPTDVLFGAVLGVITGLFFSLCCLKVMRNL